MRSCSRNRERSQSAQAPISPFHNVGIRHVGSRGVLPHYLPIQLWKAGSPDPAMFRSGPLEVREWKATADVPRKTLVNIGAPERSALSEGRVAFNLSASSPSP